MDKARRYNQSWTALRPDHHEDNLPQPNRSRAERGDRIRWQRAGIHLDSTPLVRWLARNSTPRSAGRSATWPQRAPGRRRAGRASPAVHSCQQRHKPCCYWANEPAVGVGDASPAPLVRADATPHSYQTTRLAVLSPRAETAQQRRTARRHQLATGRTRHHPPCGG